MLSIDESIRPVKQALRRVPAALEEKIEAKLKDATEQDITEPLSEPSS